MSMSKISILACDSCGRQQSDQLRVSTFKITAGVDRWQVDLCEEHAAELLRWVGMADPKRTRPSRQPTVVFADPDEIPRVEPQH